MATKRSKKTQEEAMLQLGGGLLVIMVIVALVNPWASVALVGVLAVLLYIRYLARPIPVHTEQIGKREYSRLRKEAEKPHVVMLGPNADGHDVLRYKRDQDWRKRHNIENEEIPF
jgi:hypothetical protein